MSFTRKMFRILTKRILTCLFKKRGLFSILVQSSQKVAKKVLVFRKVAKSCSPTRKLLKILKVAKKLPSRTWKGLVSFRGFNLIQNFRRASPPPSYVESLLGDKSVTCARVFSPAPSPPYWKATRPWGRG